MLRHLTMRNCKVFFKDKGMFITSMIAPLILILLFVTFLGNVYRTSFESCIPKGFDYTHNIIDGFVGGWLFSSLLAVSCITVAFCSNTLMVQDKMNGARQDLMMAPVKKSTMALSYFLASWMATMIICLVALAVCFVYLGNKGWYLSNSDVVRVLLDVMLVTMFGTSLSSCINHFLTTQGQVSAVGTIVSACYGFICGAYMPISQFSENIAKFMSYLPGTYGTGLLHKHLMQGVMQEMKDEDFPTPVVDAIGKAFDCDLYFRGHHVSEMNMYAIMIGTVIVLTGLFVILTKLRKANK